MHRAGLQTAQRLDHEIGADGREARRDGLSRIVWRDREFVLEKDISCVEARVDAHGRDTRDSLAIRDGPLNGCCTAIFRQE